MQYVRSNGSMVYLESMLLVREGRIYIPLVFSVFERSGMMVRSFLANLAQNQSVTASAGGMSLDVMEGATCYVTKLVQGMETLYHGIAVNGSVGTRFIVTTEEERDEDVYSYLMNRYNLPLLKEWVPYILQAGREHLSPKQAVVQGDLGGNLDSIIVLSCNLEENCLKEIVSNGLMMGHIKMTENRQNKLEFSGLDEYFKVYGHTIVDNLKEKIQPLSPIKERAEEVALLHKRLYPQQSAIVNGLAVLFENSQYGIMNCGCGTGKTVMGIATVEEYFYRQYLKKNLGKTIKDAYLDPDAVKYRNIVLCPSHLVEKWKREIEEEVPYVKVTIIKGLTQLDELLRSGSKRTGKEFYVLSKDTGKLSYSYYPQPYQMKHRKVHVWECKGCGQLLPFKPKQECSCGKGRWVDRHMEYSEYGLVCPECGELLYPLNRKMILGEERSDRTQPLTRFDFTGMSEGNKECRWCHASLWMPACEPVQDPFLTGAREREKHWKRISHYANKARRNMKSVWVHKDDLDVYLQVNGLNESEIRYCNIYGTRRFAPATYIKKKLKGYFDFAIFDEVHELKGGKTAQGIAMHSLVKASRKQLGLTGTIAGGYANHIFYLIYRLDPGIMKKNGYEYSHSGETKFAEKYGTIETLYEVDEGGLMHNSASRGRALSSPKCRPGISPMIFSDFLMGKTVFLDLTDMSRYLPEYKEEVRLIPLEQEVAEEYRIVLDALKEQIKNGMGRMVLGSYLQFALSYTDKPYGRRPILSPLDGSMIAEPADLSQLVEGGSLLNKEQCLVELVGKELAENRNVVIYCEYTGEPDSNITWRLKEVLEEHCVLARHKTVILESSSPQATEREAWLQKMATAGTRVVITNPKCVETGIDMIFFVNGIRYNFPTLVFYQLGYNLFTMWQASRRAFRLIQTEECRTYYLASLNTLQVEAIKIVAEKQAATASIQGAGFSAEGLTAIANGIDPRVRLANAVASESENEDAIQSLFDVLHHEQAEDADEEVYEPMLTYYELTGRMPATVEEAADMVTIPIGPKKGLDLSELLEMMLFPQKKEKEQDVLTIESGEYVELQEKEDGVSAAPAEDTVKPREEEKNEVEKKHEKPPVKDGEKWLYFLNFDDKTYKNEERQATRKTSKRLISGQFNLLEMF